MFVFTVRRIPPKAEQAKAHLEARAQLRLRAAVERFADLVRMYCPVDTGSMQRSVHVFPGADGKSWSVVVAVSYAAPVIFGHVSQGRVVPPNLFMDRARAEVVREYPDLRFGPITRSRGGLGLAMRVRR